MPKEGKLSSWLPFASGVLGALLGGLVQYYAGRSLETQKQLLEIQLRSYDDFVKAEADREIAKNSDAKSAAYQELRSASFRIVIFSPTEVVESLAAASDPKEIEAQGPCAPAFGPVIQMYKSMRRQALGRSAGNITDADMAIVLFQCRP